MGPLRKYDSTVARIAGNIAAGLVVKFNIQYEVDRDHIARHVVELARAIVAEVERTESSQSVDAVAGT